MKNFPLIVAVVFLSALPAVAQLQSDVHAYRVDNFDLASGVRIESPAPVVSSRKMGRGRVLTSAGLERPSSLSSAPLTNMNASGALAGFTTGNPTVDSYIIDSGRRNSVDPLLLYAISKERAGASPPS